VELATAASGFVLIATFSSWQRLRLVFLLTVVHGFWRRGGRNVVGADSHIYRDFLRKNLRILSGYDNWIGYDFLAADAESDAFLRCFYARHCAR
jgi:hypothetical protein